MVSVGVRDLKDQLSLYLQFVKNGESVIVTEHDKVIAEISTPRYPHESKVETELQRLSRKGVIILAKRNTSCVPLPETAVPGEKIDWFTMYDEVREDSV
ncbi:MAG: type II toxin-antitoxin system prevent-host-death family antitoxin [Treponema sp.]|jgi:antitoxin (DNA-binding transcriptional repressor) of toxin-antitoxin stability system|nr:type II toxin-antitoxin system prevent-host-death family antitoxin [Treponema sp.]